MKRVALVCLVACGAPVGERSLQSRPARPADSASTEPERALRIDTTKIVDTSIAAVWASPPPPPAAYEPPQQPNVDEDRVALPVARARQPGRRAPCFANRDVLVGSEVWRDLAQHAVGMSSDAPPSTRYGSCTIKDGELRDARGTLLAELHCGITIHVPGIIDERGFEVGASTTEIAAEFPGQDAICWGEAQAHARCWFFTREDDNWEWSRSHYVVAAPIAGNDPLRGDAARALFAARRVTQLIVRMSCH